MKKIVFYLLIFILILSAGVNAETYQAIGDYGIEGIAYLGNTKQQITDVWGEPDVSVPLELYFGSYGKDAKAYYYTSYSIILFFNSEDLIVHIAGASDNYVTREGVRIGDTVDEVVNIYGNDYFKERAFDPKNDYRLRYEKLGYEFAFRDGKVIAIGVFRKN